MNKRIRFNSDDDLALLKQVLSQNVLQDPEQWDALKENMHTLTRKEFSVRGLKDHLKYLLEIWKKKDAVNIVRSGVEEILSERDNLLQETCDIARCVTVTPKKFKKKKTRDEQQSSEIGVALRDLTAKYYTNKQDEAANNADLDLSIDYEETVNSAISDHDYICVASTSQEAEDSKINCGQTLDEEAVKQNSSQKKQILVANRKRRNQSAGLRKSGLSFIEQRSESEHKIRLRELQLQEEKLQLEKRQIELQERQFRLEEKKTEQHLEIERRRFEEEISDRNTLRETISAQKELIQTLLEQLKQK